MLPTLMGGPVTRIRRINLPSWPRHRIKEFDRLSLRRIRIDVARLLQCRLRFIGSAESRESLSPKQVHSEKSPVEQTRRAGGEFFQQPVALLQKWLPLARLFKGPEPAEGRQQITRLLGEHSFEV